MYLNCITIMSQHSSPVIITQPTKCFFMQDQESLFYKLQKSIMKNMTLSTSSNFGVWSLMLNASEVKNSKREKKWYLWFYTTLMFKGAYGGYVLSLSLFVSSEDKHHHKFVCFLSHASPCTYSNLRESWTTLQ
jgi:hypothetical protein